MTVSQLSHPIHVPIFPYDLTSNIYSRCYTYPIIVKIGLNILVYFHCNEIWFRKWKIIILLNIIINIKGEQLNRKITTL